MAKKALGRGLGALIPNDEGNFTEHEKVQDIEIERVVANTYQPRSEFEESRLQELATSIKQKGVIQPVVVVKKDTGYELVSGERRVRAARMAGFKIIPAIIRNYSDKDRAEIAIVENVQREDLNPLEEAHAYYCLINDFQLTQKAMAGKVGKSRAHIANTLRLLDLGPGAREHLEKRRISAGHARTILPLNTGDQELVAEQIAREGLSVRETEKVVKRMQEGKPGRKRKNSSVELPPEVEDMQSILQERFGTKVRINYGEKKGRIEIEYYSPEDLIRITDILAGQ